MQVCLVGGELGDGQSDNIIGVHRAIVILGGASTGGICVLPGWIRVDRAELLVLLKKCLQVACSRVGISRSFWHSLQADLRLATKRLRLCLPVEKIAGFGKQSLCRCKFKECQAHS